MDLVMPMPSGGGPAGFAAQALMWAVMMVAMMLPAAAPMLLLFAAVQRRRGLEGRPVIRTAVFGAGYFLLWFLFSLAAAGAQLALQSRLLLSPRLVAVSPLLGAGLLFVAGAYQWSPWKAACLAHCQSPLGFVTRHWREGAGGALAMGLRHGGYCLGCCWAAMGLLFVGGVMNLLLVAVLAVFILLEKSGIGGRWFPRASGLFLIGWGAVLLVRGL